nr:glycosyltransferase family 4 protein [Pararhodobacter sp. SW119]
MLTPAWPGQNTANGITTSVAHLREGLESCGHDVTIVAMRKDAYCDDDDVIEVPSCPWTLLDKLRWRLGDDSVPHRLISRSIAFAVREAERKFGVSVFVMEETQGWARWLQDEVSVPVVVTLRGPWAVHKTLNAGDSVSDAHREAREAAALNMVQGITAPSRDVLEATRKAYGLPDVPQTVVPNAVTPADQIRLAPSDQGQRRRLLFVGRYDRHKGGDTVIDMFNRLAASTAECSLSFVGPDRGVDLPDGSMQGIGAHLAILPEPVRQRITVLGQRSKSEIMKLRQLHGITLIASRYEVFGNVMAEAMAVGSPIVCTRVGGPAEILRHEETALLVPPDDPEAMAKACARLFDDPELADKLGHAAREFAEQNLSPVAVGRQMADFLERVVNSYSKC